MKSRRQKRTTHIAQMSMRARVHTCTHAHKHTILNALKKCIFKSLVDFEDGAEK